MMMRFQYKLSFENLVTITYSPNLILSLSS